jgi:hypothetical protein
MEKMRTFLDEYEYIWQELDDHEHNGIPCMDFTVDIIDGANYYGGDFSGKQKVCRLFFTGQDNYFAAIWIGNDDIEKLDEYPIYVFDMGDPNTQIIKSEGNFKKCIEKLIDEFGRIHTKNKKKLIKQIKEQLNNFSDNMIDKGDYCIKRML